MALKGKRPPADANRGGKTTPLSLMGTLHHAGVLATKKVSKPGGAGAVETIEARLEHKAAIADAGTFASKSLGQMAREKRHKLLYGD